MHICQAGVAQKAILMLKLAKCYTAHETWSHLTMGVLGYKSSTSFLLSAYVGVREMMALGEQTGSLYQ